jgi:AraC-like DNA-binding protein
MFYIYNRLSRVEHLHSRFELFIPWKSEVRARMDGKEWLVHPGEMLVVFPGVPHALETVGETQGVMLSFYEEHLSEMGANIGAMQPGTPVVDIDKMDADVAYCLKRLTSMAESGKVDEMLAQAYLTLLFIHLVSVLDLKPSDPASDKELLYRAMQYISQNLASALNLKGTARALGVNSYYLSHVLNERIHMGFRAYLNTLRMERARRYLRLTSWSVEEISAACGFNNLRTFDRVFAEHCGCSPRDFRKENAIAPVKK